jgi:hypothetical protein
MGLKRSLRAYLPMTILGELTFLPFFSIIQAGSNDKAFGLENLWKKAQKHYP